MFKHSTVTTRKLDLGQVCARIVFGDVALLQVDLETTFQGLWDAQLSKSFLKILAAVRDGSKSSHPWAELACIKLGSALKNSKALCLSLVFGPSHLSTDNFRLLAIWWDELLQPPSLKEKCIEILGTTEAFRIDADT